MKGATTLHARFQAELGGTVTPDRVLPALTREWDDETVRRCGLSRQKRAYLIDLSEKVLAGELDLTELDKLTDEEVIAELTRVKGVGVWTAEMILIFCLCRADVLPIGDLGLREAVKLADDLPTRPTPAEVTKRAQRWRPHRTAATWYLWRGAKGD